MTLTVKYDIFYVVETFFGVKTHRQTIDIVHGKDILGIRYLIRLDGEGISQNVFSVE